ncbi:hypothetical protein IE53DRAFT_408863 [Violaceomyces palustris]|uniref:Uncharacterized protein n=1 Tax=Violaceomyces palustris TaxID=1673888 RepID=A0ACD0P545_9BASI|nr:hypothetical protein IE53DRAFT_408863 [Violaceomyces palustris]
MRATWSYKDRQGMPSVIHCRYEETDSARQYRIEFEIGVAKAQKDLGQAGISVGALADIPNPRRIRTIPKALMSGPHTSDVADSIVNEILARSHRQGFKDESYGDQILEALERGISPDPLLVSNREPSLDYYKDTWWEDLCLCFGPTKKSGSVEVSRRFKSFRFIVMPFIQTIVIGGRGQLLSQLNQFSYEPALTYAFVAWGSLNFPDRYENGRPVYSSAIKLADKARAALDVALNHNRTRSLLRAAWLIALFELCPLPSRTKGNIESAFKALDTLYGFVRNQDTKKKTPLDIWREDPPEGLITTADAATEASGGLRFDQDTGSANSNKWTVRTLLLDTSIKSIEKAKYVGRCIQLFALGSRVLSIPREPTIKAQLFAGYARELDRVESMSESQPALENLEDHLRIKARRRSHRHNSPPGTPLSREETAEPFKNWPSFMRPNQPGSARPSQLLPLTLYVDELLTDFESGLGNEGSNQCRVGTLRLIELLFEAIRPVSSKWSSTEFDQLLRALEAKYRKCWEMIDPYHFENLERPRSARPNAIEYDQIPDPFGHFKALKELYLKRGNRPLTIDPAFGPPPPPPPNALVDDFNALESRDRSMSASQSTGPSEDVANQPEVGTRQDIGSQSPQPSSLVVLDSIGFPIL